MANEITIQMSLNVRNGNLQFRSLPSGFKDDQLSQNGGTPGTMLVSSGTTGQDVNLSELTKLGGWCWIWNFGNVVGDADKGNRVDFGIWDVANSRFWPLGCVYPGMGALFCLSPELGYDENATGTGTGALASTLRLKANSKSCRVAVMAFDP